MKPATIVALTLALSAGAANAQGNPRARVDKLPTHAVRGLSPAQTQSIYARMRKLLDHLAAQPAIANPVAPVCTMLHPWVEQGVGDEGVAMGSILIGLPATRRDGSCQTGANTGIQVWINRLRPVFGCMEPIAGEQFCRLIRLDPGPEGFQVHRGPKKIVYVYNRSGAPLMLPATREQYLQARERHWSAQARELREQYDRLPAQYRTDDSGIRSVEELARQARAELQALSPEQRALPACLPNLNGKADAKTPHWSYGRACEPGFMLGRPNPGIFTRAASRAGIETVVFETDSGRTGSVEPYLHEYKLELLRKLDFAGLARALAP